MPYISEPIQDSNNWSAPPSKVKGKAAKVIIKVVAERIHFLYFSVLFYSVYTFKITLFLYFSSQFCKKYASNAVKKIKNNICRQKNSKFIKISPWKKNVLSYIRLYNVQNKTEWNDELRQKNGDYWVCNYYCGQPHFCQNSQHFPN